MRGVDHTSEPEMAGRGIGVVTRLGGLTETTAAADRPASVPVLADVAPAPGQAIRTRHQPAARSGRGHSTDVDRRGVAAVPYSAQHIPGRGGCTGDGGRGAGQRVGGTRGPRPGSTGRSCRPWPVGSRYGTPQPCARPTSTTLRHRS